MTKPMILCAALAAVLSTQAGATGRLADLRVLDRTEGRSLAVHWHRGRAYVAGRPGDEYRIRLRNRSGERLLAREVLREPQPFPGFVPDPPGVTLLRHGGHG